MMDYPFQDSSVPGSLTASVIKNTQNNVSNRWGILSKFDSHQMSSDVSLFSSSLPVFPCEKYFEIGVSSIEDNSSKMAELHEDVEVKHSIKERDLQGIGSLLPDGDELFDGIMSDYNQCGLPDFEQIEDCDLFSSGGGIELDTDPIENVTLGMGRANFSYGCLGNGNVQHFIPNGVGTITCEHPNGEHPSRTLFVRNINSNVEDSELRFLFEQYGDIRSMYTHCKHRGFVMISYYDIRHAWNAMRALQNKPLRRRKLDIHFSIPKDNPSDKDLNQGTLVVFNLDPSVSNDDLRQRFGAFGEIKEIRETPHKKHHKFVEFYDVRAAEDALHSLNRSDIAGKRIKLEPSRPGGACRNLMQQLNQESDNNDIKNFRHQVGSPYSPPGAWAVQFSSPVDNSPLRANNHSPTLDGGSSSAISHSEKPSVYHPLVSNFTKLRTEPLLSYNSIWHGVSSLHAYSFQERGGGLPSNSSCSSGTMASFGSPTSTTSTTSTEPQVLWGSPNRDPEYNQSSAWSMSSLGHALTSNGRRHGIPYVSNHGSLLANPRHVGSAPSGIPCQRHPGSLNIPDSSFGNNIVGQSKGSIMANSDLPGGNINQANYLPGNVSENASPGLRITPYQRMRCIFTGPSHRISGIQVCNERGRIHRVDISGSHLDIQKLFQLDLDKVISGEDTRTTLMIKNIPNKYTSKMLVAAIDENHRGAYDFLYLPIDFKNKCNVGYAFINMASPSHIISFYQAFNGRKWEKFNSEKVALLSYARIQGKAALVAHFQNSSLMNEEKRLRPILFNYEGVEVSDQEPFLANVNSGAQQQEAACLRDLPESLISKVQEDKPGIGSIPGGE